MKSGSRRRRFSRSRIDEPVLGGGGGAGFQCAVGPLDHEIEEKFGGSAEDRINFFQKTKVGVETVVIHQVPAQPAAANRPEGPHGLAACRDAISPQIAVVMTAPAAGIVQHPRGRFAFLGNFADKTKKRFGAVGQVCRFHVPVIHFKIDVGGVIAVPRRMRQRVPDALQVAGLGAGPRRGDGQVAAIIIKERGQGRREKFISGRRRQTFWNRAFVSGTGGQGQDRAPVNGLIVGQMLRFKLFEAFGRGLFEIGRRHGFVVNAAQFRKSLPILEIGTDRDVNDGFRAVFYFQYAVDGFDASAGGGDGGLHPISDAGAALFVGPDRLGAVFVIYGAGAVIKNR